jgi:5-methylthioadenosine/S-adenosylhomocysteine deaminase
VVCEGRHLRSVAPVSGSASLLLVRTGSIVTMDVERRVLPAGTAVALADGGIVAVGAEADLRAAHPDAELLDCGGGWITPGYVDGHQHLTGDRLARCCIPDDLPPGDSIFRWAVPLHAEHTGDDDELSATLAAAEAARNGVTTVIEAGTVAHPERVAAGLVAVGLRGSVGTWGWDPPHGPFAAPAAEVVERQRDVLDRFPTGGLVEGWVTLVGHDLMSDELLLAATELARRRHARMTFHISPGPGDAVAYLARTGVRPVVHFERLDVLGPHLLLGHAVHLDDEEVELVLSRSVAVASCPWAYLRLGQGYSRAGRHVELVRRGGRVALGCDSENAADQIDVLRAAALFAGLAKDVALDPATIGAQEAFALATRAGAEAVGLGDRVGTIEVGRRADLVVHDVSRPNFAPPGGDPYLQLVWGTDGRSVRHTVVDGRVIVRDGRCTGVDEGALQVEARAAGLALRRRAGLV